MSAILNASENIIKQAVVKVFRYLKIQFFIASGFVFVHATFIFCLFFKLFTFLRCGLVYAVCTLCTLQPLFPVGAFSLFLYYRIVRLRWADLSVEYEHTQALCQGTDG